MSRHEDKLNKPVFSYDAEYAEDQGIQCRCDQSFMSIEELYEQLKTHASPDKIRHESF